MKSNGSFSSASLSPASKACVTAVLVRFAVLGAF